MKRMGKAYNIEPLTPEDLQAFLISELNQEKIWLEIQEELLEKIKTNQLHQQIIRDMLML